MKCLKILIFFTLSAIFYFYSGIALSDCKKIHNEILKLMQQSPSKNCAKADDIYREHLKKCYETPVDDYSTPFQQVSEQIGACYLFLNQPENAKSLYEFSLKFPNWQTGGPLGCDGHELWKANLESLEIPSDSTNCLSLTELKNLIANFQISRNLELLKNIRAKEMTEVITMESCTVPFESFSKNYKDLLSEPNLIIQTVQNKYSDDKDVYSIALHGFKKQPKWRLVLNFKKSPKSCYQFSSFALYGTEEDQEDFLNIYSIVESQPKS